MAPKILVVSGSRADWGLLAPVVARLRDVAELTLSLAVTGQHLAPGIGSLAAIEDEGFTIDHKVDIALAGDDPVSVTRSMSKAIAGFAELLHAQTPDLLLVLGDRYEVHAAVYAALFARVPVAHLCGGDVTQGAIDDAIRHSITKMSHLHFVSNAAAQERVAQLGEPRARIFNVGSPGLDRIAQLDIVSREELFASLAMDATPKTLLVTYHPVTAAGDAQAECQALCRALAQLKGVGIIVTGSNADPGGRLVDAQMQAFVREHPHAAFVPSLGSQRYFSALRIVDAVVGNSSSGLYEAPSFKIPTVNIGDRQKGRLRARSVLDCAPTTEAIGQALKAAFALDCSDVVNPYGDGHSAERIVDKLKQHTSFSALLHKSFVDLPHFEPEAT